MKPNVSVALRKTRVLVVDRSSAGPWADNAMERLCDAFPHASIQMFKVAGRSVSAWLKIRRKVKQERPEMVVLLFNTVTQRRLVLADSKLVRMFWKGPLRCLDEEWLEKVSNGETHLPDSGQYWRWRSQKWTEADAEACQCSVVGVTGELSVWQSEATRQLHAVAPGLPLNPALSPDILNGQEADLQKALIEELLSRVGHQSETLKALSQNRGQPERQPILYSRLDYWNAASRAGGSLGHTAHVIRGFSEIGAEVRAAAGFKFPMVDAAQCPMTVLKPPAPEWQRLHHEHQHFAANASMSEQFARLAMSLRPAFIYERIAIGNCVAAETARALGVPYVVEYNGSEMWIARHWGKSPFQHEELFTKVEDAVLNAADMIVVISEPLRQELLARGIEDRRILVNYNATDPHEFDSDRLAGERKRIRTKFKYKADDIVLGFIGTFGAWHGIPTLAKAMPDLVRLDKRVHVLMIGDGNLRNEVDQSIRDGKLEDRVIVTGIIPQAEAPAYLAACDIYLSPHQVPPDDSRPFFGSPTKLFEYMAMGKPTIASDLGQIAEIVTPALRVGDLAKANTDTDAVGVLTKPGDVAELVAAVDGVIRNPKLGERLASQARKRIVERHTWTAHVSRIVDKLEEITGQPIYRKITGRERNVAK